MARTGIQFQMELIIREQQHLSCQSQMQLRLKAVHTGYLLPFQLLTSLQDFQLALRRVPQWNGILPYRSLSHLLTCLQISRFVITRFPELIATSASGGSGPYTYQWQNSPDGSVWTNIPGATDLTYSPPALTSTTYYRIVVIDGGTPWCGTVNSAAVLITVSPVPATPTASNNGPLCAGADLNLTTPAVTGATYAWSGPNGFTSALQNPTIAAVTLADAGTYSVTVTLSGCTSATGSTDLVVNNAPTLTAAGNNPASCGADGSIDFTFTNVPNGSYTITYATGSFTNVNVSGGAATVTAPAGAYNNLEISVGTCTSAAGVNVTINAPSAPTLSATGNNPASCGADGSIDFTFTNVPNGSYTITYASGSFTNVNVSGGAATVTASAGAYNNLEISVGTCTSAAGVNVTH